MTYENERGETSIQTILAMPILILLLCIGVQAAALIHAGSVASLAADRGAVAGAAVSKELRADDVAVEEASRVVRDLGSRLDGAPGVMTDGERVVVSIAVKVQSMIPFLPSRVVRTSFSPLERFLLENQR